jgi:hypothetical protein
MSIPNETIVDRVVARLKAQPLGDLITEEDLHDIVKQAIPKAFFEERFDARNSTQWNKIMLPPVIVEIMRELLQEAAKTAVKQWLTENAKLTADTWKEVIDKGLFTYVKRLEEEAATGMVKQALRPMIEEFNKQRQAAGLTQIPGYF